MKQQPQSHGGTLHILEKGETANPNGRPVKLVSKVLSELKQKGYRPVTNTEIVEVLKYLMGLPKEELGKLAVDEEIPAIVGIISAALINQKYANEAMEKMMDRMIGKPTQTTQDTEDRVELPENISTLNLTNNELIEKIIKRRENS
jgi:hypothetical protein